MLMPTPAFSPGSSNENTTSFSPSVNVIPKKPPSIGSISTAFPFCIHFHPSIAINGTNNVSPSAADTLTWICALRSEMESSDDCRILAASDCSAACHAFSCSAPSSISCAATGVPIRSVTEIITSCASKVPNQISRCALAIWFFSGISTGSPLTETKISSALLPASRYKSCLSVTEIQSVPSSKTSS